LLTIMNPGGQAENIAGRTKHTSLTMCIQRDCAGVRSSKGSTGSPRRRPAFLDPAIET
jgi:hypothetical protein